ncbi:hypothetical protein ACRQ5Q_14340 [Bradyrhizobium sp. PMVTL-01]|uniref:hypothetical protein n=1 Tax=unclassified Bradyrhizobium TaxID=2631580 RepID=UPI003F6ECF21
MRLAASPIRLLPAVVPMLGRVGHSTSVKARSLLGWQVRSNEEAILATAESLVWLGLLKP